MRTTIWIYIGKCVYIYIYIHYYILLQTKSGVGKKKSCNMIFHFHKSGQEVKALWSCAMLRCRWMMDRNAMDASAVKTGCGHCNGLGFRHNSCMEHDMPEHDTWITLQILGPISIHRPWWNSGWCDLEVWKAHQFCNLCMFTNQQVSLLVPIYHHFVHGIPKWPSLINMSGLRTSPWHM